MIKTLNDLIDELPEDSDGSRKLEVRIIDGEGIEYGIAKVESSWHDKTVRIHLEGL